MANLKNYYNPISNNTELYTRESIKNMSAKEFYDKQNAAFYQYYNLGIPTNKQLENNENVIHVKGYYRNDGTHVKEHYRTKPDSILENNLSYRNKNTYNGKITDFSETKVINPLKYFNDLVNTDRPNARELMSLALCNPNRVPDSEAFSEIDSDYRKKVASDLKLDKQFDIDESLKWYMYNDKSLLSKSVSSSLEIQHQIMEHYSYETNSFDSSRFEINSKKCGQDLHYALGRASIIKPRIDKDGNFSGLLFDKYDFRLMIEEYFNDPKTAIINNFAVYYQGIPLVQNIHHIHNYYILVPVKFKVIK